MNGTARTLLAGTAALCVAGSTLVLAAGAAVAEKSAFKSVSAPKNVVSGQAFTVKCTARSAWTGAEAVIQQKGATVNAKRTVGTGGNCTMRLILDPTGKQKIRVVLDDGVNAEVSPWLKVRVNPS